MAKDISIEIGFEGGGSTAVGVPEDRLDELTAAITKEGAAGWLAVSSGDGGEFLVDVSKVIFVRVGSRNRTMGFASA